MVLQANLRNKKKQISKKQNSKTKIKMFCDRFGNSQQHSEGERSQSYYQEIFVKDRLPLPLPLLPRANLNKSQQLNSLFSFVTKQKQKSQSPFSQAEIKSAKHIGPGHALSDYAVLPAPDPPKIKLDKLQDMLRRPQQIVYDIMGREPLSVQQATFGFQYVDRETRQYKCPYQQQQKCENGELEFESRFESGNLLLAYKYQPSHYLLIVRPDFNTINYCQWFYFSVKNKTHTAKTVRFSILNMTKSASLFSQGMKICTLFATGDDQELAWTRAGQNISYTRNQFRRKYEQPYYTLTWQQCIPGSSTVYFAYSQPYTYTSLMKSLKEIRSEFAKVSTLCYTSLKNRVDVITISSDTFQHNEGTSASVASNGKKVIVILSRTHPGETVGSFVMKGLIRFLLSDNHEARMLRQRFVFKLVPMVNPDGVINGNSRCCALGYDLNRCWSKPTRQDHPQIYHLKKMIISYGERLVMFCDLHGHSKKKNIFAYGCNDPTQPSAARQLPFILSKLYQPFSYKDCNFHVNKYKSSTARVSLWKKLKIPNIFTLQSSFCGGANSKLHLDEPGYLDMGINLCKAINLYFSDSLVTPKLNTTPRKRYIAKNLMHRQNQQASDQDYTQGITAADRFFAEMKQNLIRELYTNKQLLEVGAEEQLNDSESQVASETCFEQVRQHILETSKSKTLIKKGSTSLEKTKSARQNQVNLRRVRNTAVTNRLSLTRKQHRNEEPETRKHSLRISKSTKRPLNATLMPTSTHLIKSASNTQQIGTLKCITQAYEATAEQTKTPPRSKANYTNDKAKPQTHSALGTTSVFQQRSQKIEKFVPHITNFNFQEKFNRNALQAQYRSKQGNSAVSNHSLLTSVYKEHQNYRSNNIKQLEQPKDESASVLAPQFLGSHSPNRGLLTFLSSKLSGNLSSTLVKEKANSNHNASSIGQLVRKRNNNGKFQHFLKKLKGNK